METDVGELITQYRKEAGLTIDELVVKSGVPKGTLTKIITGITKAPTLDNIRAIAKALGKSLADFEEQKNSPAPAGPEQGEYGNDLLNQVIDSFNQLNVEGQERLAETADDMVQSGKYIKSGQDEVAKES